MHNEQRHSTAKLLGEKGIDCALFTHRDSVGWLTGYVQPVNTGPNFFAAAPPMVWYEDGKFTLIALEGSAVEAFAKESDGAVLTYPGYTIQKPITSLENLTERLKKLWQDHPVVGSVGVEQTDLTTAVWVTLQHTTHKAEFSVIDGWLKPLRMVKTAEELLKLKENFRLSDIGHAAARKAIAPGKREIDVWEEIHAAMTQAAGYRIPIGNDLVVGYRQNNIGGWPLDHLIRPGDTVIVDLSAVKYGYWSDSCATYYTAAPTSKMKEMYAASIEALALGKSLLKPGAISGEIDQRLRKSIVDAGFPVYPHHTGHGVGLSGHEEPRIVPYNDIPLEVGMVIMLEPGTYFPGETGVRNEDAFLITENGCEQLTQHDKSMS